MARPKLTKDEIAELLAITDRVERVRRISAVARRDCTLPTNLSEQRKADLAELRKQHRVTDLSELIQIAKSGICRLAPKPAEEAAV